MLLANYGSRASWSWSPPGRHGVRIARALWTCSRRYLAAKPFENRRNRVSSRLFDSHRLHYLRQVIGEGSVAIGAIPLHACFDTDLSILLSSPAHVVDFLLQSIGR